MGATLDRTNVVLTGLPRSGTTLTCHLLNKLPDTVALHEPIAPGKFADLEGEDAILDGVERFFKRMRRMALDRGEIVSKHVGGEVPANSYGQAKSEGDLRSPIAEKGKRKGRITVQKDLGRDFLLVIKSPAMFSALLPALVKRFPAYAVIRNPLSILASWNSIDHNLQGGHSPAAERYDERLRGELASIEDGTERQLYLLSWWYDRFQRTLPDGCILRYEDIVGSGGAALSALTPAAKGLAEPLESQNLNAAYDREKMRKLGSRLLDLEGAYWRFYTRESVAKLVEGLG
jgi:hypothetical protein